MISSPRPGCTETLNLIKRDLIRLSHLLFSSDIIIQQKQENSFWTLSHIENSPLKNLCLVYTLPDCVRGNMCCVINYYTSRFSTKKMIVHYLLLSLEQIQRIFWTHNAPIMKCWLVNNIALTTDNNIETAWSRQSTYNFYTSAEVQVQ